MSLEDAKREAMALCWSIRQDDGTYTFNDSLLETLINLCYGDGYADGIEEGHKRTIKILDDLEAKSAARTMAILNERTK